MAALEQAEIAAPPIEDAPRGLGRLGVATRAGYGLGSLASGISGTVLGGSVLQVYFNQVIGLPAAWVGAAVMLSIVIDAVIDPLIGRFSDGLRTRWGRRHLMMYASAAPASLGVVLMWHAPGAWGPAGMLAFMVAMLTFVRLAVSCFDIPLRALAPELAPDYHDRTGLIAWRFVFGIAGGAAMNAVLYYVFLREDASNPTGLLNQQRYVAFGSFAAAMMFITIVASTAATHHRIRHLHVPPVRRPTLKQTLGELKLSFAQPGLVILMFATLLNGFGGGLQFGLDIYIVRYFWELKPQANAVIGLMAPAGALISLWVTPKISSRVGKRPYMAVCYVGWLVLFLAPYLLRWAGAMPANGTMGLVVAISALSLTAMVCAFGVHTVLQSMLSDAADDASVKTGRRSEGTLFAAFGVLDKWGQGIGALAAGTVLALVAFPTRAIPGAVPPHVVTGLVLASAPLVAGCNVFALYMMSRFRLGRDQHAANIEALRRREGLAQG
ncbi:MAG TPA: MFS transporter [Caulobacteraceae bacterium]|nr:MFS transporter [Caulobacteraceae bacterium]